MNKIFTGLIIIDGDYKELYSLCDQCQDNGKASLSLIKIVRDRDFPGMRIAKFAQGNSPTVVSILKGE